MVQLNQGPGSWVPGYRATIATQASQASQASQTTHQLLPPRHRPEDGGEGVLGEQGERGQVRPQPAHPGQACTL